MAHSIAITNGVTTVSLTSSGVFLTKYTPVTPMIRTQSIRGMDGDDVGEPVFENVTEVIELMPYSSSTSGVQTIVHGIERLIDEARQRQKRKSGAKVYLTLQIDGEGSSYRSEILTGRFEPGEEALTVWGNYQFPAKLQITRRYYWEGSLVELEISTSNQGASTGGRTIKNHDDSGTGDDNWVQIAAAQVDGVLPAPVYVRLVNTTGSSQDYRHFYLATNAYSDPANFAHIIEGETVESGYGTTSSDANSSGGSIVSRTLSSTGEMHWTIPAATLVDAAGRDFRILMRMSAALSGGPLYVTPAIRDGDGLINLATGDEVRITTTSDAIVDLGTLPLPPGGYSTSWDAMRLILSLRTTVSTTISIDFFQLTPMDSFRRIYQRGYPVVNNAVIIDDSIEGYTVLQEGSADQPIYTVYDGPLTVFPNRLQRVIILHDEGTAAPIANQFELRLYYRPRRLSI